MADVFHSVTSWRVFIFSLFLIYKTSDSVSSNVLKKCYRHRSYGLQSTCDAKLDDNDNSAESAPRHGNTQHVRHGIRLSRIDPVKIDFTREIQHEGKTYTLKTLSLRPPIFEIQNFLSNDECDDIVEMAKYTGLESSKTIWSEFDEVLSDGNLHAIFTRLDMNKDNSLDYFELSDGVQGIKDIQVDAEDLKEMFGNFGLNFFEDDKITFSEFKVLTSPDVFEQIKSYLGQLEQRKSRVKYRKSFSTFLDPFLIDGLREFYEKLYQRISKVTQLPIEMIRSSESLQVIKYDMGGHYHAHLDSESSEYAPCCHVLRDDEELCRPCRYATMFYYLNEPAEGGGTAFPFADNTTYDDAKISRDEKHRLNLSAHCDKANLVYMPRKGSALFWYNHVIDDDTGWVGDLDQMSHHGGCDVIRGEKWAANNWLNAASDRDVDLEIWENFKNPS